MIRMRRRLCWAFSRRAAYKTDSMTLIRALRPLHWSKNVLLFVPLLLGHRLDDRLRILHTAIAFALFCIAASGTYLLNDVHDAQYDRAHPLKRRRFVASGELAMRTALGTGIALVAAALVVAHFVVPALTLWLVLYVALTFTYSWFAKQRVFLDVLALAGLYAIRVLAGGAVARIEVSNWLLALSVFFFLALALMKRYADLGLLESAGHENAAGRGYVTGDRDLLRSMGVASGMMSVLVLALYVNGEQVTRLYGRPQLLWLVCVLLLYWNAHMWFLAHRGAILDDPIVIAVRDPTSYVVALLVVIVAWLAL